MISDHAETFAGLPIVDFDPRLGVQNPEKTAIRLGISYDDFDAGRTLRELLGSYVTDPAAEKSVALVIGVWDFESSNGSAEIVHFLAERRDRLPNLRAIFFGDITSEEQEISWINQSDMSPLLAAFPLLEELRVRGGNDLEFKTLDHEKLRSLVVETGGLGGATVRQILAGRLPELTHLELWLGSNHYGADYRVEDLESLFSGSLFPKLRYLGLRDSELADEIAAKLASSPLLERIQTLDLSLGTLGDAGLAALLASPAVPRLERLDIHYHYASDAMVERLEALGIEVDASDAQSEDSDDGDRYVAVAE